MVGGCNGGGWVQWGSGGPPEIFFDSTLL